MPIDQVYQKKKKRKLGRQTTIFPGKLAPGPPWQHTPIFLVAYSVGRLYSESPAHHRRRKSHVVDFFWGEIVHRALVMCTIHQRDRAQ